MQNVQPLLSHTINLLFAVRAENGQVLLLEGVGVLDASAYKVVDGNPLARLLLHLPQRCDHAGIGLLSVGVHAGAVHGPAQSQDDVVLGHAVLVLVDLQLPPRIVRVLRADQRNQVVCGHLAGHDVLGRGVHARPRGRGQAVGHFLQCFVQCITCIYQGALEKMGKHC